jgi:hypothetical protein
MRDAVFTCTFAAKSIKRAYSVAEQTEAWGDQPNDARGHRARAHAHAHPQLIIDGHVRHHSVADGNYYGQPNFGHLVYVFHSILGWYSTGDHVRVADCFDLNESGAFMHIFYTM